MKVDKLNVQIADDRQQMGKEAARMVSDRIRHLLARQQTVNIIFASAPSQNEFLAALAAEKNMDWSRVNAFHMDEYIGLSADAPQNFGTFLRVQLFDKVRPGTVYYLNGNAPDLQAECNRYTELLRKYPADIVCMGIGENCHIAFNDPHVADFRDPLWVKTVSLDETSRQQQVNDGCFDSLVNVPRQAITVTIPALLRAGCICCIVPGANKAGAVYYTLQEEVHERYPSTILRDHADATLFIDRNSAGKISYSDHVSRVPL